ncbi:undecaprenyl-diphosphate phosphatase [Salinibacterium sp. SWN248]|uniref:undecaprenyl-diphosphate phosphatase n=1 Tax=Salinibacterium sp. SWN248 TaxID=2792056 RepID=UPI0018CF7D2A|nr:undecaprenyl-diphosphate phosphatase [Salinibacterium sp. SWN248]MBH0024211.1 undecaprenyl-diphosphate phosphatase [Salinibacterium sp. SWN248]
MGFIEAIILGLVQGLTEFLPISSSAHLRIMGEFLPSASDPGATFTAITQLGTELAVILFFRKDIARILSRWFQQFRKPHGSHGEKIDRNHPDVRLGWLVIIGTIPIVLVGYFAQEYIRSTFRSLWLVATVLIVFGIILGIADYLGKRTRALEDMSYGHGITIGLAQMLALVPGVSRSGSTMTAGLALGYTRPAAARFGFLLAIPAVFGSGLYELVHSFGEPNQVFTYTETAVATVIAFFVGYVVIAALMRYIEKRSFLPFVIYRVVLGVTLYVLLSLNVIQPV